MKSFLTVLLLVMLIAFPHITAEETEPKVLELLPIETILVEPIGLTNINIWVPAAKAGPFINKGCTEKSGCLYSLALPGSVNHTKSESCPKGIAKELAKYTADYYRGQLPFTIFNGWQWEYSYSLCEFESVTYNLLNWGGSWESSWEAILKIGDGTNNLQWVNVLPSAEFAEKNNGDKRKSNIRIRVFSSVRIRDGYPKKRRL